MSYNGWKEAKLGDILEPNGYIRGPFGSALRRNELHEQGIPVYEQKNAIYNHRKFRFFIDKQKYNKLKRFTVKENDLMISCSGTVGKVSIIKKNDPVGIISQALLLLRGDKNKIDSKFFYYFLTSREGYNAITSVSSGSVQVNIAKRNIIENISIYLPNIAEQKAIVATLSCLDNKIELNNRINKTLKEMAQAIFKSWFVDFEPFQDGEFVDSELGRIPKGWSILQLKDVSDFQNGYAFYKVGYSDKGVMVIDLGNVDILGNFVKTKSDKFISTELYNQPKMEKFHVLKDDLVIIMTDRKSTMDLLGKTAKISNNEQYILNQRVGRIRPNACINVNFLYTYLNNEHFLNELKKKALGSVQKYVNTNNIKDSKLIIPNNIVMTEFGNMIDPIFEQMEVLNRENQTLNSIRDALLPKLMSGEIRVPIEEVK